MTPNSQWLRDKIAEELWRVHRQILQLRQASRDEQTPKGLRDAKKQVANHLQDYADGIRFVAFGILFPPKKKRPSRY